jgi:hypothetical protein
MDGYQSLNSQEEGFRKRLQTSGFRLQEKQKKPEA